MGGILSITALWPQPYRFDIDVQIPLFDYDEDTEIDEANIELEYHCYRVTRRAIVGFVVQGRANRIPEQTCGSYQSLLAPMCPWETDREGCLEGLRNYLAYRYDYISPEELERRLNN